MIAETPALSLPRRHPRAACRPPTHYAEIAPRFTLDGGRELEEHLARTCDGIAAGIRALVPRRKLEAVLLGGGYGRGEGGVLRTANGDRPYNDLEFYVCIRGNRHLNERRFGRALHVLGEILTPQAGVEVEFRIISLDELRCSAISMFSYDLVAGHRWLIGDDSLLSGCAHHREPDQIPLAEATRLLMNRCSGLLFAKERLARSEFTPADADFVFRNIAKAQLALGDALAVCYGHYHWSVQERHRRVERLARIESMPWLADVVRHHAAGVAFKLHPERSTATREALAVHHVEVTALAQKIWLWLEGWRLHAAFGSPRDYVKSTRRKCPETSSARNVLVNLKTLGLRALMDLRAGRHPRERVLNALTLLLWAPDALTSPPLLRRVQRDLQTAATTLPDLMRAYRTLWANVN